MASALDPLREEVRLRLDLEARLERRRAARPTNHARSKRGADTRRSKLIGDPVFQSLVRF